MSKNFELLRQAGISLGTGEALSPQRRDVPSEPLRAIPKRDEKNNEWIWALQVVRKHWRLSALFAAVVIITVVTITLSMKPVYEPVARIEVDPPGEVFSLDGNSNANDSEYLETQAQNLKSDKLAVDVIRRLHLNQQFRTADSSSDKQTQPANLAPYQLTDAENDALHSFRAHLTVTRDTASRLISVSFWSNDPKMAALVTNTVAETFIEDTYKERHDAIVRSSEWLSRQLDDIRGRMEDSNRVLAEFQKSIGVADIDDNKSTFTEHIGELNQQLTQAQADRIQLEALLKSVKAGNPDVLPEIRNNPVVQQLSTRLAEVRSQLAQAQVVYGVNHPKVKELQSQANELQAQLDGQKAAVLGSIRSSYSAARAREQLMDSQIKDAGNQLSAMARYNALKHEAQANSDLYNSLYAKVKEAGIAAASKSSNLRVVDEARVLDVPTRPARLRNILIGIVAALLGGIGLAFVREQFDSRIFTAEDVRNWIGAPNVAIIPLFFSSNGARLPATNGNGQFKTTPGNGKLAPGVQFLLDYPHSPEAEALRSLYTSVMLSRPGNPPQTVLVVSSFPGEGKTTVAVNLAIAMAQHGTTCLVDADLRRGRVAAAFGIPSNPGLTEFLNGATSSTESVLTAVSTVPNLSVIPAHAGDIKAGQLVCSERMQMLINELRERFQYVVIDSAPLLPFADGRALSNLVDGLIFVGRAGMTTRQVVLRSMALLDEVHAAPILEFVLNAANLNSPEYRYYQYAYEYYQPVKH